MLDHLRPAVLSHCPHAAGLKPTSSTASSLRFLMMTCSMKRLRRVYCLFRSKYEKPTHDNKHKKKWLTSPRKISLWTEVLFYLIPGFIVFIFIPAVGFVLLEDWSFVEGVYYAFVTLTTIGFGDLVARGTYVKYDANQPPFSSCRVAGTAEQGNPRIASVRTLPVKRTS